jgi:site-specific DNA-methyltransferase (cytosine-N4-specific)
MPEEMMYTITRNRLRTSDQPITMSNIMTNDAIQVLTNDALTGLKTLPDKTVQACLTSPPFYLLRRYGTSMTWPDGWNGELGHEPHPNDFVRHLLFVFDEVWRTLRDDGCLWVNLADTFNNKQGKKGTTNAPNGSNGRFAAGGKGYANALRQQPEFFKHYVPGIAHKSEMGVPFRFHLAMTDPEFRRFIGAPDGPQWICRRTIIWAKSLVRIENQAAEGNAMPEPTRDRTSRNYEFLFLFAKQPDYYFDRTAIDVPSRASAQDGVRANAESVWETQFEVVSDTDAEQDAVWRINPEASPYRHVAMWPRALVRQMLLPSTREGDTILDPFAGSGTTGEVAVEMGRKAILIESSDSAKDALADRIERLNDRPIQQSLFSLDE